MFKKALCPVMLMAVLVVPVAAWGATSTGNVSISCTVEQFFQWPGTMSVTVPNITAISQTKSRAETFTCYMNHATATAITVAAAGDGKAGVLTDGSSNTLTTAYGLAGAGIQVADRDVGAPHTPANFFLETYNVEAAAGSIELILTVSATSSADPTAIPAGAYTCGIVFTATWS